MGFCDLEEPDDDHENSGWRIAVDPSNHPVNLNNFDVLIGAEGKRVTVPGKYKRKLCNCIGILLPKLF